MLDVDHWGAFEAAEDTWTSMIMISSQNKIEMLAHGNTSMSTLNDDIDIRD